MALKEEKQLQTAFSKREKNEKLLSNLEKLKEEGSVTDGQYGSMKSSYTQIIDKATSEIEQIKNGLSGDIESEGRTLETYKQELKNLETRFKVGELSAEEYQKSEQKIKSKIEKTQASLSDLKRLHDSKTSADVGGYVEPGGGKGAKPVSVGKGLPALEDVIANKKILFGIIGVVAVIAIIAGIVMVSFDGSSAVGVMKQLSGGDHFSYINFKTIEKNRDLANIGEYYSDNLDYDGKYGITKSDYSGMAATINLIGGVSDLESIRYHLDDIGLTQSEYENVELWKIVGRGGEASYGGEQMPSWLGEMYEGLYGEDISAYSVALLGDKVVAGNGNDVKAVIKVIKGETRSLYATNPKMTCIADKLPNGFIVMITSVPVAMEYDDLEAMGISIQKISEGRLEIHHLFLFDDKYSAGNAEDDIRSDLEEEGHLHNIELTVQDRYVTATATCDIEDWKETVWW